MLGCRKWNLFKRKAGKKINYFWVAKKEKRKTGNRGARTLQWNLEKFRTIQYFTKNCDHHFVRRQKHSMRRVSELLSRFLRNREKF